MAENGLADVDIIIIGVVNYGSFIMQDSSDEEETVLEKVCNFAEQTVPNMTDRQFQQHFRMECNTFEDILGKMNLVQREIEEGRATHFGFPRTALEKEMMIMIWYLSNLESLRSVADRFGVSKSTCWDILYRTSKLLLKVNNRYGVISWPSQRKQNITRQYFQRKNHFPGVIGCIDGSHIPINAPKQSHVSYINRKGYHSVVLQAVCDHKRMFLDVYAGETGCNHDYTVYRRSDLYENIQNGNILFYDDNHLLGDLAYKLNTKLLVGFKNNGHLSPLQKNYNYILSSARVKIENAFALLKGRFRRLKLLETIKLDLISLLIVTTCILHNICLLNDDTLPDIINLERELQEERRLNPLNVRDIHEEENENNAIVKRLDIMNVLPMNN